MVRYINVYRVCIISSSRPSSPPIESSTTTCHPPPHHHHTGSLYKKIWQNMTVPYGGGGGIRPECNFNACFLNSNWNVKYFLTVCTCSNMLLLLLLWLPLLHSAALSLNWKAAHDPAASTYVRISTAVVVVVVGAGRGVGGWGRGGWWVGWEVQQDLWERRNTLLWRAVNGTIGGEGGGGGGAGKT